MGKRGFAKIKIVWYCLLKVGLDVVPRWGAPGLGLLVCCKPTSLLLQPQALCNPGQQEEAADRTEGEKLAPRCWGAMALTNTGIARSLSVLFTALCPAL